MILITYLPRRRRPLPYTVRVLIRIALVAFAAGLVAGFGAHLIAPIDRAGF
jgi:hypothetical protein